MPIDINCIRADKGGDPEKWREYCRKRFKPVELVDNVIALDAEWRKANYTLEKAKKEIGIAQKKVTELKKAGATKAAEADEAVRAMSIMKDAIPALEADVEAVKARLDKELDKIPNEVDPSVPYSKDEKDNLVVRQWGECSTKDGLLNHHEVLAMIDGYEAERGVGVAGHRAYFLKGVGLLLNQALINYGISFLMNREYTPLQPPFFMNREVMAGIAQLEDFDEQLYKVQDGEDVKYLIATSEQPICAFHKDEWLQEKDLPKRYAGYSTCFRKEAGSSGRDTWGIFRVHQFEKIEQFIVCEPEHSKAMQQEMILAAEDFYKSLGISYHVVNIVSGELNNAATMKYDLEGWFPAQKCYRELVSCSNCTDYQARAMEVRCGVKKLNEREKKYCHFLNSTLCATTRTICAILENYQTSEGVKVPDVLVPYMGGRTFLPFIREKPIIKENLLKEAKAAKAGAAAPAEAASPAPKAAAAPAGPKADSASAEPVASKATKEGEETNTASA